MQTAFLSVSLAFALTFSVACTAFRPSGKPMSVAAMMAPMESAYALTIWPTFEPPLDIVVGEDEGKFVLLHQKHRGMGGYNSKPKYAPARYEVARSVFRDIATTATSAGFWTLPELNDPLKEGVDGTGYVLIGKRNGQKKSVYRRNPWFDERQASFEALVHCVYEHFEATVPGEREKLIGPQFPHSAYTNNTPREPWF